MPPIETALAELDSLSSDGRFTYTDVAKRHGVERSTLRRRHQAITEPRTVKVMKQQQLTPEQELELVSWINDETKAGMPPLGGLVREKASLLAGKEVGEGWVYRFLQRQDQYLISKWATGMDRVRHQADSESKYKDYFTFVHRQMDRYGIEPRHTYNMDEKGILMGKINRSKRIFSRKVWERKQVQSSLQDGSREWISILACICADGTVLDPGLIYQSDASQVQSSWVEDIRQDRPAYVTASVSGWSNNEIGLAWLEQVFDRQTKAKARHSWRLLFVDGHDSHISLQFLDYCGKNRILVVRFPSHSTHTLQPLDVVAFKSLSSHYSNELNQFMVKSHGMLPVAKRDFFGMFWSAWDLTFKQPLILKAFEATGISPRNAEVILQRFHSDSSDSSSDSSGSDLNTWYQIHRRFKQVVKDPKDRRTQQLSQALHRLHCRVVIAESDIDGLEQALTIKKKRKRPSKAIQVQQYGEPTGGAVWMSPHRIEKEIARIRQEEDEAKQQKLLRAEQVAVRKSSRELEAKLKQERVVARAAVRAQKAKEREKSQLNIQRRKAAAQAKTQHQTKARVSKFKSMSKASGSGSAGGGSGGDKGSGSRKTVPAPRAPLPPPRTSRLGRSINKPGRYR